MMTIGRFGFGKEPKRVSARSSLRHVKDRRSAVNVDLSIKSCLLMEERNLTLFSPYLVKNRKLLHLNPKSQYKSIFRIKLSK